MVEVQETLQTEAKILEAATAVFRAKGREGARMQEIADMAGINKAMLHYYFRSKDLLFEKVFLETAQLFFSRLNEIIGADMPFFEKIQSLCEAYIDMSIEKPFVPVFIIGEINRGQDAFIKKMFSSTGNKPDFQAFKRQIHAKVEAGEIHPIAPYHLIMNIMGLCVFPSLAKPMLQFNLGMSDEAFNSMLEDRKRMIPEFIITSLKKNNK